MNSQFESDEIWSQRIKDYKASGLGLAKWCEQNGVTHGQMSYRLYKKSL